MRGEPSHELELLVIIRSVLLSVAERCSWVNSFDCEGRLLAKLGVRRSARSALFVTTLIELTLQSMFIIYQRLRCLEPSATAVTGFITAKDGRTSIAYTVLSQSRQSRQSRQQSQDVQGAQASQRWE
jgi:hypothetical protein